MGLASRNDGDGVRPKVALVYIDAGGGHRASARALSEVMRRQQPCWDVQLHCLQDLLDPIDFIRKWTGVPFQDLYNIMLRRGWTLGTAQLTPLAHLTIRLCHKAQVRTLAEFWSACKPDVVVSLIPHYNRALKEALETARPGSPFVTVLTDIADYPPHFWIERQDQYVICGSKYAAVQAMALGIPAYRVLKTSGMILHPRFYAPLSLDRAAERIRLGLKPDLPTGLVLFGGEGSHDMVKIGGVLNRRARGIQLIFLCGKNEEVARKLRSMDAQIPMSIVGFTDDVPFYMELSDFFIGKPGPGSLSEALAKGLPVIVQRNAWTLAHERYNADWIEELGAGLVLRSFSEIDEAVSALLAPEAYRRFRQRACENHNTAVFEIPPLIEKILSERVINGSLVPPEAVDQSGSLPLHLLPSLCSLREQRPQRQAQPGRSEAL